MLCRNQAQKLDCVQDTQSMRSSLLRARDVTQLSQDRGVGGASHGSSHSDSEMSGLQGRRDVRANSLEFLCTCAFLELMTVLEMEF